MNHQANIAITMEDEDQVEQHYEDEAYGKDVNEEINYEDISESLVIQRILLNEKQEDSQKHHIFKPGLVAKRRYAILLLIVVV